MQFSMNSIKGINSCAVIGANGFLGKVILEKLLVAGYTAYGVYHKDAANIPKNCNKISITSFVESPVSVDVIIFAAGSFSNTHQELVYLNCTLVKQITDQYPHARLIYVSSANVYGEHTEVVTEESAFNAPGLYGRAKLAGEFVASLAASFAIVRLVYLYGKGLNNGSFLPNILRQAKENKNIVLYGKGKRKQDYLHVEDAAILCIKLAENNQNGIFLGATGISLSNLEVAEFIKENIPDCVIEFQGEEFGQSCLFDATQTWKKIRCKPIVNFSDGIKTMLT